MWVRGKMDIWAASFVEGMGGLGGIVYTAYYVAKQGAPSAFIAGLLFQFATYNVNCCFPIHIR